MGTSLEDQGVHPANLLVPDPQSDPNPGLESLRMKVECSLERPHEKLTLYVHSKPNVNLMVGLDWLVEWSPTNVYSYQKLWAKRL